MEANWNTFYREACIAADATDVMRSLWVAADSGSESEALIESVKDYLDDRFNVALAFCDVILGIDNAKLNDECDIPF